MRVLVALVLMSILSPPSLVWGGVTIEEEVAEAIQRKDTVKLRELIPELHNLNYIKIRGEEKVLMLVLAYNNLCGLLPLLFERGARRDARLFGYETAMDQVVRKCISDMSKPQQELLDLFIEQRVSPNDILRHVAIDAAARGGSNDPMAQTRFYMQMPGKLKIMEWAIKEGADVDVESEGEIDVRHKGVPIIYWLARSGLTDFVKFLLDNGANPNVSYNDGRVTSTAMQIAGNIEIKKLLEDAGARR